MSDGGEPLVPTPEELSVLSPFERFAFRVTHRMNLGRWKRFWTWCQSFFGAGWIQLSTYNLMRVYGLENIEAVDHARPILLVANHRSFFDMYTVSTVLFRRTPWRKQLFFPVRGRFFYQSLAGMFVNGTRNKGADPYSYLRPQPGVGKLIKDANPQVVPVFIAGLGNKLAKQVLGNWFGGEKIRIHFGTQLDLSEFMGKKDRLRTYKEIADFVMSKIAELGEADRKMYSNGGRS